MCNHHLRSNIQTKPEKYFRYGFFFSHRWPIMCDLLFLVNEWTLQWKRNKFIKSFFFRFYLCLNFIAQSTSVLFESRIFVCSKNAISVLTSNAIRISDKRSEHYTKKPFRNARKSVDQIIKLKNIHFFNWLELVMISMEHWRLHKFSVAWLWCWFWMVGFCTISKLGSNNSKFNWIYWFQCETIFHSTQI